MHVVLILIHAAVAHFEHAGIVFVVWTSERFEPTLSEANRHDMSVRIRNIAGSPPEMDSGRCCPLRRWPTPLNAADHKTARADYGVVHFSNSGRVFRGPVIARTAPVVLQAIDAPACSRL
jgi:hypothetical protein